MRIRFFFLLAAVGFAPALHAQVKLELLLKQDQYLAKESLEIGVRVVNHSGQDLNLTGGDWLDFVVMDADKFLVKEIGPMPVPDDVSIKSSYMGTQWLDIGHTFDFEENAYYTVQAHLKVKEWGREYFSEQKDFEIIRGASIWRQKFGVPPAKPGDPPEFRTYVLQQAIYLEKPQLYLRVTDEAGQRVLAVERIAPLIQVSKPEAQIDTLSRLHVFTQVSMKDFSHIIVDPDGVVKQRHTYIAQGLRPTLKVSPSGGVYVAGGVRQLRESDIPTPERYLAKAPEQIVVPEEPEPPEPKVPTVAEPFKTPQAETPVEPELDPIEKAQRELEKRTVEEN